MSQASGPTVVLLGALDTKAQEYDYVRSRLESAGLATTLIDFGVLGEPAGDADVTREEVAAAAGESVQALATAGDRNRAMTAMATGARAVVRELFERGSVAGVMALGGSNAGYVMGVVSAALPIGCPKILVSTIVAGDTRPYVGTTDLTMLYPVVDISGLNSVSRMILARAADACIGMVQGEDAVGTEAVSAIGLTMFGVTTPCVSRVQERMESSGYETHVFHCTGTGGRTFEAMIRSGLFSAVADVTTTELADELLGGVCSAGPERLTAAAETGVPQVVSLGALDMANFWAPETVPEQYADRLFHAHNPNVTLMRTTPEECEQLAGMIAERLNGATASVEVHVPARGFSQISTAGGPFHDPAADAALIDTLKARLDERITFRVHDLAINDPEFADEISRALSAVATR